MEVVDDEQIVELHRKLVEVLGPNEADTLMALLLRGRWEFIAHRNDIQRPSTV